MEKVAAWQAATLAGIVTWIIISSLLDLTRKFRSFIQPWVISHVISGIPFILQIQKCEHKLLDALFSAISCVVSVPFYTAFLPLLFWSGHGRLARQMTLLMAFCDYIGNCIKDVVSAPRPSCPPVRRLTATKDEEENAQEYGLPSSHTLNTVCLAGYLLCYVLSYNIRTDGSEALVGFAIVGLAVGLIALGRIYLGMHSLIDIIAGFFLGLAILAFWLQVHEYVDSFVTSDQNVTTFWAALSFLLLFAYPTPEFPTPSYDYHTAFNGVSFGIIAGVQQTYNQFHHENVPRIFTPELTTTAFIGRMLVGIPTILLVKFCSKVVAKWTLPVALSTMGVPIRSTNYVPGLISSTTSKKSDSTKQPSGFLQRFFFSAHDDCFDVDTGIRFIQYAGLAWSVVDLVPSLFSRLNL
ncbi:lipid phosphate phosphatase delta [Silene latifolia]|uniref:lipid phosphate phosphatase delta n=1 Tax=Silene latifolia TaxID=37657 RepID=UPI003D77C251